MNNAKPTSSDSYAYKLKKDYYFSEKIVMTILYVSALVVLVCHVFNIEINSSLLLPISFKYVFTAMAALGLRGVNFLSKLNENNIKDVKYMELIIGANYASIILLFPTIIMHFALWF